MAIVEPYGILISHAVTYLLEMRTCLSTLVGTTGHPLQCLIHNRTAMAGAQALCHLRLLLCPMLYLLTRRWRSCSLRTLNTTRPVKTTCDGKLISLVAMYRETHHGNREREARTRFDLIRKTVVDIYRTWNVTSRDVVCEWFPARL